MLSSPPLSVSPDSKLSFPLTLAPRSFAVNPCIFSGSTPCLPSQNPILFQKKTNLKMDHLILSLLLLLVTSKGVSDATFTFVNSCDYTVWPGILENAGSPRLNSTGFELPRQTSRTFQAPTSWGGRFWGRTGCNFNGSGFWSCQTGDCGSGTVECNGAGAFPPATLVEFTLAGASGLDFYDVSIVDGYNLPVIVEGTGGSGQCPWTGCSTDLNLQCPSELASGNGSACRSACEVFRSADYCCSSPYGSPLTCRQSVYSEIFKAACPKSYSYAYDDATSTFTCTTGADYTVTFCPSSSPDNLVPGKSLSANQSLPSFNGTFALGFFSPENSTKFFLGIWYNTVSSNTAIVWVANRESPLDSPGVFTLSDDGNLVVLDGARKVIVWSSNVSVSAAAKNSTTGLLMDTGNLVLRSGNDTLWESFDHPSDTILPGMKISLNKRTGQQRRLTSWAAVDDPQPGNFTLGIDPKGPAQFFIWNENTRYVRSTSYIGKETNTAVTVDGENEPSTNGTAYFLTYNIDADEAYLTYGVSNSSVRLRFRLNPNGQDELLLWMDNSETWFSLWKQPVDNCDFYARCGPYGSCHRNETLTLSSPCKCLTGFTPKFPKQWAMGNWSGGCVREKPLRCDNRTEGYFEKFERLKLPDQSVLLDNRSIIECKSECNQNCSCTAYAYVNSTEGSSAGKCLTWFGDLMDVVENQTLGQNIYVRLPGVPHGNSLKRSLVIAIVSAIAGTIFFGYFLWKKTSGKGRKYSEIIRNGIAGGGQNDIELPLFSLKSILAATNNFSEANKLGEGGFGPVYKGVLHVHEVAMKRLSKKSGQGHQEFMNELKLIANLQHTNLVRLLGCCVEDEEQILVYEYMPNRSLDKFLFDPYENKKLDWDRRFHIIEGIAQGVLYIHKYSRLKIIHRDLKASNVLLDGAMNPKISDFGMAKIFEINQTEANTNRVVGTYGYMSPEYARYGHFSEKSDVFSFGVLLLEIISGKKNASFYHYEHSLTLAGWAWKLWKEGRGMEVIDVSVRETCQPHEALRCIHVGFLCVQEAPADRPTMSSVVHMLQANEGTALTPSKEPAFSTHRNSPATGSSSQPPTIVSVNSLTISTLEGR